MSALPRRRSPRLAAPTLALLAAAAAASTGCGARSALPSLDAIDADGGAPPPATTCPAALQTGAPAPMLGYCSTRAYGTPLAAPSSPHVTWSTSLGMTEVVPTVAVDAAGSAYVAQASPVAPATLQILRVDPPGTVAWTSTFDGSVAGTPIVGADGNVRVVHFTGTFQPEMIVVGPDGATVAKIALPDDSDTDAPLDTLDPAVGKDGSLYLLLSEGPGESGRVARIAPDGTLAWRSAPYTGSALSIALAAGDEPIVLVDEISSPESARVLALDPASGATRWSRELPGQPTAGPSVRADGAVVILTDDEHGDGVVWLLSPADGATSWSANTGALAGIWLAVGGDGALALVSGYTEGVPTTTVTALDPGGTIRWQHVSQEQVFYSGVIDASGQLLLASSSPFSLDMATGATRWTLPPPSASCVWPMTMSTGGVLYGTQCDGTFFAASD